MGALLFVFNSLEPSVMRALGARINAFPSVWRVQDVGDRP